jgi:hypothetical protein
MSKKIKITIRNKSENGSLVGLPFILRLIPRNQVAYWILRNATVCCDPIMFGAAPVVEAQSRMPSGFQVSDTILRQIMDKDFSITDGLVEGVESTGNVTVTIDCIDSSQWEIFVDSNYLSNIIQTRLHLANHIG